MNVGLKILSFNFKDLHLLVAKIEILKFEFLAKLFFYLECPAVWPSIGNIYTNVLFYYIKRHLKGPALPVEKKVEIFLFGIF